MPRPPAPNHPGAAPRGTPRAIIREAGLSVDEFLLFQCIDRLPPPDQRARQTAIPHTTLLPGKCPRPPVLRLGGTTRQRGNLNENPFAFPRLCIEGVFRFGNMPGDLITTKIK